MTITFVGAFNPITSDMPDSSSGAGAKVQYEIIKSLSADNVDVTTLVMQEYRTWPYGDFYIKGKKHGSIDFLPMINLFFSKKILFALSVFIRLLINNPEKVYFYNTNAFLNFFMFILGLIRRRQIKILIIQDYNIPRRLCSRDFTRPNRVFSYYFSKLTKYSFQYFIPITKQLGDHLGFPYERCHPFLGGVISGYQGGEKRNCKNIAVFAGALEPYNGVDYLLVAWSNLNTPIELHIFGSGSLAELVSSYSKNNSNIIFHGFQSPITVKNYIECASVNFCFRYSRGIEQEFFFPSKFFDVVSNRGIVICNRFINIPIELDECIYFVDDEFSNLNLLIENASILPNFFDQRIKILSDYFSWTYLIKSINSVKGFSL